jgi:hypothetical protein
MYIDTVTGTYPLTEDEVKAKFPDTLFSAPFVPPPGFALVAQTPHPQWNPVIESVTEGRPELKADGWVRTWEIHKTYATPEQEAAAIAADKEQKLIEWRKTARVSAANGRKHLAKIGKLTDVENIFAASGASSELSIDWEYATEWERNSPLVSAMLPALGSEAVVDSAFSAPGALVK